MNISKLSLNNGLTITEVMVSLALLGIGIMVFAGIQSFFANDSKNRFLYGCLTTSASSALAMCMSGQTVPSSIRCGGISINLNINGSCIPPSNGCNTITATASYNNISYQESENVCSF